jgi:N-acetylglucosaminyl-diphospho-decaprenol L-rhamnosyltransferase
MHDLAIIIVSTNEGSWLEPCLTSVFEHAGDLALDVVVVDNESTDDTKDVVGAFPGARIVPSQNRGFSHANNRGLMTSDARYVLFLNPDTEILEGTFADVVRALDERPSIGLVGVRQVTADGELFPTIRRSPNALRALGEALGSERLRFARPWLGERELDLAQYDREVQCDWTSGSFMLARREAIESAGYLDERFFIYAEETDLCLRITRTGWEVWHLPRMTILHHADKAGASAKMEAQGAFARRQYARKNFSPLHRYCYLTAVLVRHGLRALLLRDSARRAAARRALATLVGVSEPPFGAPPSSAVALRHPSRPG